ncbi:MAG: uroporphyrinogen decarboxylase family protein [Deferrisomatales bacterium]|nr:uroporphyrinogen decarboxylase family protein [Deferrisomatales bacterium]
MSANENNYQARQQRLENAIALRQPDRVPVVPLMTHYYATRSLGISNRDSQYDIAKRCGALKETVLRYDFDGAMDPQAVFPGKILEIMGLTHLKWPGGVLRDDEPFQFSGGETLKASEYDEFLADPNGCTARKLWPQMSTALAPLGQIPLPPLFWVSGDYDLIYMLPGILSAPPMLDLLKKLVAAAEEFQRYAATAGKHMAEMAGLGYPMLFGGVTLTAFDWVGDFFRNMRGVLMDMRRNPEKLLATIELLIPATIQKGIIGAKMAGCDRVFIPLHWGGGGFMSNDMYARFYWPSLKALLLGLVDAGITPIPLFEGDYTPRLEFLAELPKGKVAGHFDIVDRKKAREILGDTMCFWGNVPAALLATGTPQQVKDDVRELMDLFGDTGGLIVDGSDGIPDEARPENVAAMVEAVREYGVY